MKRNKVSKYFLLQLYHELRMTVRGLALSAGAIWLYLESHPETKYELEKKFGNIKEKLFPNKKN